MIPVGCIIIWSGAIVGIPAGFALCDGTGGTPDLRGRFIPCAGSTYAVGDTGGQATFGIASHVHTSSEASTVSQNHSHIVNGTSSTDAGTTFPANTGGDRYGGAAHSHTFSFAIADGAHVHSLAGHQTSATATVAVSQLPVYYALAYIQRTS